VSRRAIVSFSYKFIVKTFMRFSPILFDLDGTLVDSSQDLAQAVNRTLQALSLPPLPDQQIVRFVGDGVHKLMERTLKQSGRGDIEQALALFKSDYRQHCLIHTQPYPGIKKLLQELVDLQTPMGVVTNKPIEFARAVLDGLSLLPCFGAVVGGDETDKLKPHSQPIELCLQRLLASAANGLMVGDHSNDVLAGRDAGIKTCGVLWGFDQGVAARAAGPDYLCVDVPSLRQLLLGP
jgi:phosphoglycolate phosphatase